MKTLFVVSALLLLVGGACVAQPFTIDLYGGYNLISVPNVPLDPSPTSIFGKTPEELDGMLSWYDATTGGDVPYSQWGPEAFGNLLLGTGYWVTSDTTRNITFQGVADGVPDGSGNKTDMWISLPGLQYDGVDAGGSHIIGNPFATAVDKSNIYFTDGKDLKDWQTAYNDGWVGISFDGYEGSTNSSWIVSLEWGDGDALLPARAYYFTTYKDNLAMIVKAPTP